MEIFHRTLNELPQFNLAARRRELLETISLCIQSDLMEFYFVRRDVDEEEVC